MDLYEYAKKKKKGRWILVPSLPCPLASPLRFSSENGRLRVAQQMCAVQKTRQQPGPRRALRSRGASSDGIDGIRGGIHKLYHPLILDSNKR